MTDQHLKRGTFSWLPDTSHGIWRLCLLASLMINLAIAGLMIGHIFGRQPMDRPGAANYNQFVPRKFFGDLGKDRRVELAEAFRNSRPDFEKMHAQTTVQAEQIAAALVDPNYDATKINTLIDSFTTGSESVAAKGGTLLKDFYAKLTAEERTLLSKEILEKQKRDNKSKQ